MYPYTNEELDLLTVYLAAIYRERAHIRRRAYERRMQLRQETLRMLDQLMMQHKTK
ncbi:MAG: hypothetical protein MN733_07710 [Nitrososphaera sp.]|nr:hypothetical protein [Nitrososphaera sp.]